MATGLYSAKCAVVAETLGGKLVSHACIIHDTMEEGVVVVGLLAHVFTHPGHRRQGLGSRVTREVVQAWDALHPSSLVVLGTGSPHAARVYAREGFLHLLGGLEGGHRGYNVEDLGEWIMARRRQEGVVGKEEGEVVASLFSCSGSSSDFHVEELRRGHLAGLVLALCCR